MLCYLITGVSGHVGAHLTRHLWQQGHEVHGLVRVRSRSSVLSDDEWANIRKVEGDLTDQGSLVEALRSVKPDRIVALGAQANVPNSFRAPQATIEANVLGTLNLLEAVRTAWPKARVLLAGSSEGYGHVEPSECPITEDQPLRPLSSYGVSKAATDLLGYQYWKSYKLFVIRARAFNHFSLGRTTAYAEGAFAEQAARCAKGLQDTIRHGNLAAIRDFTDARDTVKAYTALLENGQPGEAYNICSGDSGSVSIETLLNFTLDAANVRDKVTLVEDPLRMRPSDVPRLIGNCDKLHAATGWTPRIPLKQSVADLVEWYMDRV